MAVVIVVAPEAGVVVTAVTAVIGAVAVTVVVVAAVVDVAGPKPPLGKFICSTLGKIYI